MQPGVSFASDIAESPAVDTVSSNLKGRSPIKSVSGYMHALSCGPLCRRTANFAHIYSESLGKEAVSCLLKVESRT